MAETIQTRIPWSDLPKELLQKIGSRLDTETDVSRFRAVCNSWRSSTAPFKKLPWETVKLPFPIEPPLATVYFSEHDGAYFTLVERTVYRVELPDDSNQETPNFWLVKTERLSDGKLRILDPLSHCPVNIPHVTGRQRVLNTLDFRVSEACKAYALRYVNPLNPNTNNSYEYCKKVIILAGGKSDEYVVLAIGNDKKLWCIKSGDEKWSMMYDFPDPIHDAVYYKGQFHVIDMCGGIQVFDLNFEMTRVSYRRSGLYPLKRYFLGLYNCELFFVLEGFKEPFALHFSLCTGAGWESVLDLMIFAMDKNENEWIEMKAANDLVIVVSDDCSYAVSTKGNKGARIFYPQWPTFTDDEADNAQFLANDEGKLWLRGCNIGVFDCGSGEKGPVLMFPESADIFLPPPSWLYRT